jgi:hypothetical protein
MNGGGGATQQPIQPTQVSAQQSYKKEVSSMQTVSGSNRKALGSVYLQRRKGIESIGGGFGGQKQTLG